MKFTTDKVKTLSGWGTYGSNAEKIVLEIADALVNDNYEMIRLEFPAVSNHFAVELTKEDLPNIPNWIKEIEDYRKKSSSQIKITELVCEFSCRTDTYSLSFSISTIEEAYEATKILTGKTPKKEYIINGESIIFFFKD